MKTFSDWSLAETYLNIHMYFLKYRKYNIKLYFIQRCHQSKTHCYFIYHYKRKCCKLSTKWYFKKITLLGSPILISELLKGEWYVSWKWESMICLWWMNRTRLTLCEMRVWIDKYFSWSIHIFIQQTILGIYHVLATSIL